ncbi:hypothetical protein H072_1670 [Dactylellina haptotyla CBS 200.50]|uniref:Uncharacterized protein n=1 Tax=Dactylellina haptotyla (strain CBS 200.50) TaxID=1284197 RepID=S8C9P1_DACHA|nr:hypothetical protein H072_1670 [Dactylellina haptotyla CBS 200.50]
MSFPPSAPPPQFYVPPISAPSAPSFFGIFSREEVQAPIEIQKTAVAKALPTETFTLSLFRSVGEGEPIPKPIDVEFEYQWNPVEEFGGARITAINGTEVAPLFIDFPPAEVYIEKWTFGSTFTGEIPLPDGNIYFFKGALTVTHEGVRKAGMLLGEKEREIWHTENFGPQNLEQLLAVRSEDS